MHVSEEKTIGREKNYSMIYTSKPLEGHGLHAEYCARIYWCGLVKGHDCYHNKTSWICFQVRVLVVTSNFCCFDFYFSPCLDFAS